MTSVILSKVLSLLIAVVGSYASGGDPINDPYDAALVAVATSDITTMMSSDAAKTWLVATGMTGTRLKDLRDVERDAYAGTAIHAIDARYGRQKYDRAVKKGYLRPDDCVHHVDDGRPRRRGERAYARWSTRGPYEMGISTKFGLMTAWTGTDCFPPRWFDVPLFSAIAATEHAAATCRRYRRGSTRRPCDWKFLRCVWAGIGTCKDARRRRRLERSFGRYVSRARRLLKKRGDM